jgi:hypothetical protein
VRRRVVCLRSLIAGFVLAGVLIASSGHAHRLSGKPRTLAGRLALAKRQVVHDRRELAAANGGGGWWLLSPLGMRVLSHRAWLDRDVAYVRQLERLIVPPLGPAWLVNAFLCIHHGEGSWSSNTGNGYYGGLQMDLQFQRTYGSWALARYGTADRWPPSVQIAVAIRAYLSGRGFFPWPNTARACGLL